MEGNKFFTVMEGLLELSAVRSRIGSDEVLKKMIDEKLKALVDKLDTNDILDKS